jgi:hypothetical protein
LTFAFYQGSASQTDLSLFLFLFENFFLLAAHLIFIAAGIKFDLVTRTDFFKRILNYFHPFFLFENSLLKPLERLSKEYFSLHFYFITTTIEDQVKTRFSLNLFESEKSFFEKLTKAFIINYAALENLLKIFPFRLILYLEKMNPLDQSPG